MIRHTILALGLLAGLAGAETLEEAVDAYLLQADETAPQPKPWKITGSFGVTVTDGNSDTTTVAAGVDASRKWTHWKLTLKLRSIYAESESVETANEHIFTERLERLLSERAAVFQDLLFEHDDQEDLSFRIQFTLGYRRRLVKKEKFELWGEVGAGVLHEEFRTEDQTEGIAQLGVNFTWQITDQLLFEQTFTVYPSLSESGEYRFISESVFSTPVSDRTKLRLAILDNFDSDPPAGIEENDLTVVLTLNIDFTAKKKKDE